MKPDEFTFDYPDFTHQSLDARGDNKFNNKAVHGFLQLINSAGRQWKKKMILAGNLLFFSISSYAGDSTGTAGQGSGNNDVLDSMIGIVIILFILSVITEKLTQLIRKYSPFIRPGHVFYKTFMRRVWRNVRKKQVDGTQMDDKVEREVNTLSFVLGLLVARIKGTTNKKNWPSLQCLFFCCTPFGATTFNSESWGYYLRTKISVCIY